MAPIFCLLAMQMGLVAQPLNIATLAGDSSIGSQDGLGPMARFDEPADVVADSAGNLFVTDRENSTIRKLTRSGTNWIVSTFAGSTGKHSYVDGVGTAAKFSSLFGMAIDESDNLYVTDRARLRRITPQGEVTTLNSDLELPSGIAITNDTLFLAMPILNSIYVMKSNSPEWTVETVIGADDLFGYGSADGTNGVARFNSPEGVALANDGTLYVADTGNTTIRKITHEGTNWVVTTLAGNRSLGHEGIDGVGTNAGFTYVQDLSVGSDGNIYVADDFGVRRVTPGGVVTTLAGEFGKWDYADGTNDAALFARLSGIFVDSNSNVFVVDDVVDAVRQVSPQGEDWVVKTIAGLMPNPGADGVGNEARFWLPGDVVADELGNVFVADTDDCAIRKITPDGTVTTIAGAIRESDYADGAGDVARFSEPWRIDRDSSGRLFVADQHRIRMLAPDGTNWLVSTLAGSDFSGSTDGSGTAARFTYPQGIAVDDSGRVFVSDTYNHTIRMMTPNGADWDVTTIAGKAHSTGSADGTNSDARFYFPKGIDIDSSGRLYVADENNNSIRLITPEGTNWVVTTPVGQPDRSGGYADGLNNESRFDAPEDVAFGPDGSLFVIESQNCTIRKITIDGSDWNVTTVAGLPDEEGNADGVGEEAQFRFPTGIDVDAEGRVYVADTSNDMIRIGTPPGPRGDLLTVSRGESGLILTWPASATNYTLESAMDLSSKNWTPIQTTPTQIGDQLVVTNPILPGKRFFQLHEL